MARLDYDLVLETFDNLGDPNEKEILDKIREMIELADDKLVFGDEIQKLLEGCQLATVYVHKDKIKEIKEINSPK